MRWEQLTEEVSSAAASQDVVDNPETQPVQEDTSHIYESLDQAESGTSGNFCMDILPNVVCTHRAFNLPQDKLLP